jgi:hypothetical protein
MKNIGELDQSEEDILKYEVSDEAIERAADAKAIAANPTVPSAIICVPL